MLHVNPNPTCIEDYPTLHELMVELQDGGTTSQVVRVWRGTATGESVPVYAGSPANVPTDLAGEHASGWCLANEYGGQVVLFGDYTPRITG